MSTDYCTVKKVFACDLFDGRLEEYGVREHVEPSEKSEKERYLTDGENFMVVYIDDDGLVCSFTRRGWNAPGKILNAVADAFSTDIVSEYEPHTRPRRPRQGPSGMIVGRQLRVRTARVKRLIEAGI